MVTTTIYPPPQTRLYDLVDATASILEQAFVIASHKQELSHQEYKNLLSTIGWSLRESKIYLKVATAFSNFAANDLKEVEPHTIFELAKHAKKYHQVIESLKNCSHITQEKVRELISSHRTPQKPKPDKPTIWKTGRDGEPVCRIPDIMEEDMQTGSIIQQEMDANGTIPQTVIRQAIALWNDVRQGKLAVVENEVKREGDNTHQNVEKSDINQQDNIQNLGTSNKSFNTDSTSVEVNSSENYLTSISTVNSNNNHTANDSTNGFARNDLIVNNVSVKEERSPQSSISNITFPSNTVATNDLVNLDSQNIFSSSEKENIEINLTLDGNGINGSTLKAGDIVIWEKCPPQYQCWQPFQIQKIEGNMVKLDLLSYLVTIDELTKLPDEDVAIDKG